MDATSPRRPPGMESPTLKFPQSEGSPLHPVSPRRINQQRMTGSPVPPEFPHLQTRKERSGSDVQSKVEFLNRLSGIGGTSPLPRSSTTTAAIQRAILGREEAENALQEAISELSESKSRERRVSERLESLLEELHSRKERQSHERSLFEKEVRKARKEAFRAGSAVVKAQEEIKSCRAEIKALREEVLAEREGKDQAKQEAFERAYTLAGLTEEVEVLRDKVKASEAGNQSDLLEARAEAMCGELPENHTSVAGRESISSTASRGVKRVQPDSLDDSSPARKKNYSPRPSSNLRPASPVESREMEQKDGNDSLQDLKNDLLWEKRQRQKAEDMIHFLKMECQFKQCSCRVAERQGVKYIHDSDWAVIAEEEEDGNEEKANEQQNPEPQEPQQREQTPSVSQTTPAPHEYSMNTTRADDSAFEGQQPPDTVMTFCPDTGTFRALPSPRKDSSTRESEPLREESPLRLEEISASRGVTPQPIAHSTPLLGPEHQAAGNQTATDISEINIEPRQVPPSKASAESMSVANDARTKNPAPPAHSVKRYETPVTREPFSTLSNTTGNRRQNSNTTTTKVPLVSERSSNDAFSLVPGTPVSREEALAQIRARRTRTQSALKRSASANDANTRSQATGAATMRLSKAESAAMQARIGRRGVSGAY